eukprot:gene12906-17295_t
MRIIFILIVITVLFIPVIVCDQVSTGLYIDQRTCQDQFDASYYFNPSIITCLSCSDEGTHFTTDDTQLDGWGNILACKCDTGYYKTENDCSLTSTGSCDGITCTSCLSAGNASYTDSSGCVKCDNITTNGLGSDNDCSCPTGKVLQETDVVGNKLSEKVCASCPSGKQVITYDTSIAGKNYKSNKYACQSCPDPNMKMSLTSGTYSCSCGTGYTTVGVTAIGAQSCLKTTLTTTYSSLVTKASQVTYTTIGTITSQTMKHYFLQAASRCLYYGSPADVKYCQILVNLCVLQLYDDKAEACIAHQDVISARGTSNYIRSVENWVAGSPWLYFAQTGSKACYFELMSQRINFNHIKLKYVVATYTMNGTFLSYSNLDTLFFYCNRSAPYSGSGGGASSSTNWQLYGANQRLSYKCYLPSLVPKQQLFYEIFHYDVRTAKYYPVPVRVLNLKSNGQYINERVTVKTCNTHDILVRRFFLFDVVSGISSDTTNFNGLQVMRYASYFTLISSLSTKEGRSKIYPSVLTINYTEVVPTTWSLSSQPKSTSKSFPYYIGEIFVNAYYIMDYESFLKTFQGFAITACVLFGFLAFYRYYNWNKRNSRVISTSTLSTNIGAINFSSLINICVLITHSWVLIFFPFTVIMCWYVFVFYKVETFPALLLPPMPETSLYTTTDNFYYGFIANLYVMTAFQLFYVLHLVYKQCNADIFFIDWEPRIKNSTNITSTTQQKAPSASTNNNNSVLNHPVSIWRTILVANEYVEMLTKRKTSLVFTLFFIGFFLIGLELDYNATPQPFLANKSRDDTNIVLKFGNVTFFFLILSLMQYLFFYLIYERYFSEPPEQLFVDFCTIAKISIIILDEPYHGYYLHCRSPYQYADTNMVELIDNLHKEEVGLVSDRSLDNCPDDTQSFQLYLTHEFRKTFDSMHQIISQTTTTNDFINQRQQQNNNRNQRNNPNNNNNNNGYHNPNQSQSIPLTNKLRKNNSPLPSEKVLKAWQELNIFLQEFVENNFGISNLKYTFHEPTYIEKMTGLSPDILTNDMSSVFFLDREYLYTRVMFLGHERDLLLLNILSYSIFDLWFGSTGISLFLCYLLDLLICYIRQQWGQAVVSRKTLVDSRFMI